MRPFLPPSLASLAGGAEPLPERLLEERRQFEAGFAAGHARGLEDGQALGHEAGFAAGRQQGQAEAEAASTARERDGLGVLNAALARLLAERAADRAALDAATRQALAGLLRLLLPALAARSTGEELQALLAEALERRDGDLVTLRAHPATLAALPAETAAAAEGQLRLLPDPAMAPGTAEAAWRSGGLILDPAALLGRALAILGAAPDETLPQQEITAHER